MKKYLFHTEPDKVLLFADILGFSNIIKGNDTGNEAPKSTLCFDFRNAFKCVSESAKANDEQPDSVRFLWMSDSIVLSSDKQGVNDLLKHFLSLQRFFFAGGMALRGAICIGRVYHEENVWGEALVRAAELEKVVSKYPRVIIAKTDFELLELSDEMKPYFACPNAEDELKQEYLYIEPIMPYFHTLLNNESTVLHSTIEVYANEFLENFRNAPTAVKDKWRWLILKLIGEIESNVDLIEHRLSIEEKQGSRIKNVNDILNELKSAAEKET